MNAAEFHVIAGGLHVNLSDCLLKGYTALLLSFSFQAFLSAVFIQVLGNLESLGILLWHFPGLESPGKRLLILESSGNLLNSSKKYEIYGRQ